MLATGSLDHVVRLWTPFAPQRPVAVLSGHSTAVVGLAIAEHSGHLFSLSQDLVSVGMCMMQVQVPPVGDHALCTRPQC